MFGTFDCLIDNAWTSTWELGTAIFYSNNK